MLALSVILPLLAGAAWAHRGNGSAAFRTDQGVGAAGPVVLHSELAVVASDDSKQSWGLRVCNAYAFESGLDAFHSPLPAVSAPLPRPEPVKLTRDGPLPYKRCADLGTVEGIGRGSLLSFRLGGGLPVGGFRVTTLPAQGALLQLVVHRRDVASTTAAFAAHVFGGGGDDGPEVALIDAYRGSSHSGLAVRGPASPWRGLHFGEAVSLKPGWYEWALTGDHTKTYRGGTTVGFRMRSREKYTAIRVGVDASRGPHYDEELVLFPTSWITVYSHAGRSCCSWRFLPLLLGMAFLHSSE